MKTQHTPGPWKIIFDKLTDCPLYYENGTSFKVIMGRDSNSFIMVHAVDCYERECNARLIAAAPELFESLKALISAIECDMEAIGDHSIEMMDAGHEEHCALCCARQAIAKATASN